MKKIIVVLMIFCFILNATFTSLGNEIGTKEYKDFEVLGSNNVVSFGRDVEYSEECDLEKIQELIKKGLEGEEEPMEPLPLNRKNCAVIVCGGVNDGLQLAFLLSALHAKRVFKSKGYNVLFLYRPLLITLKLAITLWIPLNLGQEKKVFLYFADHGEEDGGFHLRNFVKLYPRDLDNMIDVIQDTFSTCTVVIDACYSGNYIMNCKGKNRIIMTSTDSTHRCASDGFLSEGIFTKALMDALEWNYTYGKAWEHADYVVDVTYGNIYSEQNPQLEDSGNGYSVGDTNTANILPIMDSQGEMDGYLALGLKPNFQNLNLLLTNIVKKEKIPIIFLKN